MKYVQRQGGKVVGVYGAPQPQPNGTTLTEPDPLPDNHPDLVAFRQEQDAVPDNSDLANVQKAIKAAVLAAAAMSGKTPAQAKAAFKAAWDSLP